MLYIVFWVLFYHITQLCLIMVSVLEVLDPRLERTFYYNYGTPSGFLIVLLQVLFSLFFIVNPVPDTYLLEGSEKTIRARALQFLHNVVVIYTQCRKEFGDLEFESLNDLDFNF